MNEDPFLDLAPDNERWGHGTAPGGEGVEVHYVRQGGGDPVLLLHGWPGFWYDWRRVLPRLASDADAIAPDLRGFGQSDKPERPPEVAYTPLHLARDVLALMDHLDIDRATIAAHDVGATVAQAMALTVPDRVRSLVLLNPPYLGIGGRRYDPKVQREHWYQYLHAQPWADRLVAHDRETVRLYVSHFYDHWTGRKEALRPIELEAIVDTYAEPGTVRGSFQFYRARWVTWPQDFPQEASPEEFAIQHPTVVLWGEADPVLPVEWSDRIPEFFPNASLRRLPGVGHFVPFEAPEDVVAAIGESLRA